MIWLVSRSCRAVFTASEDMRKVIGLPPMTRVIIKKNNKNRLITIVHQPIHFYMKLDASHSGQHLLSHAFMCNVYQSYFVAFLIKLGWPKGTEEFV